MKQLIVSNCAVPFYVHSSKPYLDCWNNGYRRHGATIKKGAFDFDQAPVLLYESFALFMKNLLIFAS